MVRNRIQLAWALATCAVVFAQLTPTSPCRACDQSCCTGLANGHAPRFAAAIEPTGECPRCATSSKRWQADTTEQPCHCQLKARQDESLPLPRSNLPVAAGETPAIGPRGLPPVAPQVLGVNREYLAASLVIPIRPPRVLFGVWRN